MQGMGRGDQHQRPSVMPSSWLCRLLLHAPATQGQGQWKEGYMNIYLALFTRPMAEQ
jgi:hypothetical protein